MPVLVAIMMKYSDILNDGERSPRNYYEQLQRCSGLMPINIFATINNRWTINETAHESWEGKFISDSIRNKAKRFRKAMREEGIIFTRAGALLNLKVLLAMEQPTMAYKETAIGAIALHANDYVESVDTSGLAKDVLPAIAEFAPMWELQNIRDPSQLLVRSYYLYTLLQQDERMQALFKRPIAEVTLGGLRFPQYFTLLFGIYTNARNGILAAPKPTSIINASDIATKAHLTVEQFSQFAAAKALTLDEARTTVGPVDRDTFHSRVATSVWTSNQLTFRRRPLLRLPKGDFLVLDLQFLFESASAGLTWTLMDEHLTKAESKLFLDYWGGIFETYVQELLGHYYPVQVPIGKTYAPDGQIDGLLVIGDDLVVFEVKAGFVPDEKKGSRDQQTVDAALRKKYVMDDAGRRVGVRQLAATSSALLDGNVPNVTVKGRIYPVLVGEDPILQTPGVNIYLNDIFREEVTTDRIAPVTVMLVDELEQLLPHIRAADITWQNLLTKRFVGMRMVGEPVHTTLIDLAIDRGFRRRPETFLAKQSETLIAMIKDAYKDLQ